MIPTPLRVALIKDGPSGTYGATNSSLVRVRNQRRSCHLEMVTLVLLIHTLGARANIATDSLFGGGQYPKMDGTVASDRLSMMQCFLT